MLLFKKQNLLFFRALYCYIKILLLTRKLTKKNYVMPDMFHDLVKKHPNKACFLFEEETWTFQQVFYLLITPRLSFSLDQTTAVIMTDVTMLKHENNVIKSTSSDNHFTDEKCIIITSRYLAIAIFFVHVQYQPWVIMNLFVDLNNSNNYSIWGYK